MFANSNDLYLMYDGSCMDKYDYVLTKKEATGTTNTNLSTYHIKINDNEKVIFNTAKDGKTVATKPANVKYCGEVVISESLTRKINDKKTTVQLVFETKGGFLVLPVETANYFFTTDAEMGYSSDEFTFAYNYKTDIKTNLASKKSKGKIYFRERVDKFCPSKYTFRQTPEKNFDPYMDFVLVPDVGLVSRKIGMDAATVNNDVMTLQSINNIPLVQYMDAVCNGYVNYLSKEVATANRATTVTDLESKESSSFKVIPNTTASNSTTGNVTYAAQSSACDHIYKDVDKGVYFNRNTGKRANESCGGVNYNNGIASNGTSTVKYAPDTRVVTSQPATRVIYKEGPERVVYKEAPPQVIYKETPPQVIYKEGPEKVVYKDRVVYVDRPQDEFTSKGSTTSNVPTNTPVEFHTVQSKETLYAISKKYGVSIADIKSWNGLQQNLISPGQRLRVKAKAEEMVSKGAVTTPIVQTIVTSPPAPSLHTVSKGETLYSISKKHNISIDLLKSYNNLTSNTLSIGQQLNLTAPTSYNSSATPTEYSAPASEFTSKGAAKKEIPTPPAVVAVPDTKPATIASKVTTTSLVGKDLIGTSKGAPVKTEDPLNMYEPEQKVHIVGDNETLFTIAKWYGTTVGQLRALNNFDKNEVILPNQKIRVQ